MRFVLLIAALSVACTRRPEHLDSATEALRRAEIYPDSADAVLPPNVAPLNIRISEPGSRFYIRLSTPGAPPVEVFSSDARIRIPVAAWRKLLAAATGRDLTTEIYAQSSGKWTRFDALRNPIAADPIDPYVVYRYIPPIYDKWGRISIRERNLTTFDDRTVFDNERSVDPAGNTAGSACINCHTFLNHRTAQMLVHTRPSRPGQIPAMILVSGGQARKIDTRAGGRGAASYPAWHPSGRLIAFSRNSLLQVFHTAGDEPREVIDRDSDLGLYDLDTGRLYTVPQISRPDRLESWPAWSPDGRYLYFSAAPQSSTDLRNPPPNWDTIRYDLDRVSFDPTTGRWGAVETVVSAASIGKSISEPAISPDGQFVLFTAHDHGSFPIFQPDADLYLAPLYGPLPAAARRIDEIDSSRADGYHSWSSNGRWVIFSSKRDDGVFTRFYIAHADSTGHFGKPFLLPQEDPDFYLHCRMAFNRPEFVAEPVSVTESELTRAINSTIPGNPSPTSPDEPYRPARQ